MVGQRRPIDDHWALELGFGSIRPQHTCETRDPHDEGRRRGTARKGEEIVTSSIYSLKEKGVLVCHSQIN